MVSISERFAGFLPIVIDVETGGLNHNTDALLELAAITLRFNSLGELTISNTYVWHIAPFKDSIIEKQALIVNGIDINSPKWNSSAVTESKCIDDLSQIVNKEIEANGCKQAILVGHNPSLDLNFLKAVFERLGEKDIPFHQFRTIDTATLGVLVFEQIKLSSLVRKAGFSWNEENAHSAKYDVTKTAEFFCKTINLWKSKNL